MKLSKKGEYALRSLINLGIAAEVGRSLVQVSELADTEQLLFQLLGIGPCGLQVSVVGIVGESACLLETAKMPGHHSAALGFADGWCTRGRLARSSRKPYDDFRLLV